MKEKKNALNFFPSPSAHLESPMKTKEPWRTIFPGAQRDIKQKTRTRLLFRLQKLYEAQFIFKTRGVETKKKQQKKPTKMPGVPRLANWRW